MEEPTRSRDRKAEAEDSKTGIGAALWQWLRENAAPLQAVGALVLILTVVGGVLLMAFSEPEVAIEIESSPLLLPSFLSRDLSAGLRSTDREAVSDTLGDALRNLTSFLDDTRHYSRISIRNNTGHSVENVDIRIRNVRTLTGWSVTGDGLTLEERRDLLDRLHYDRESSQILIPGIGRIPPRTDVVISLWVDAPLMTFRVTQPVVVTYDGGAGHLVRTARVSGLNAFIYENSSLLLFFFAVLILGVVSLRMPGQKSPR